VRKTTSKVLLGAVEDTEEQEAWKTAHAGAKRRFSQPGNVGKRPGEEIGNRKRGTDEEDDDEERREARERGAGGEGAWSCRA